MPIAQRLMGSNSPLLKMERLESITIASPGAYPPDPIFELKDTFMSLARNIPRLKQLQLEMTMFLYRPSPERMARFTFQYTRSRMDLRLKTRRVVPVENMVAEKVKRHLIDFLQRKVAQKLVMTWTWDLREK